MLCFLTKTRRPKRGFTLLESMVVVAITGIMAATAGWQIVRTIPTYRASGAARKLLFDLRNAPSLAARLNRRVQVNFSSTGPADCNPSYSIGEIQLNNTVRNIERVCLNKEFPNVALSNAGLNTADLVCRRGVANTPTAYATRAIPNCTLCTGSVNLIFSPNGRVKTASANGDSIIFAPAQDATGSSLRAVAIENVTGRPRIFRLGADNTWECP